MRSGRRFTIAIGVLVVLAAVVGVARWYQSTQLAAPGPAAPGRDGHRHERQRSRPRQSARSAVRGGIGERGRDDLHSECRKITLETALPPIVTARGLTIVPSQRAPRSTRGR